MMRKTMSTLLAAAMLLPCLTGCSARADQRTGEAQGYGGPLKVTVTVNGDDITNVQIVSHSETEGVGTRAIETLPDAIKAADSIDVDSVSGATVTSNAIKQAVSQALGKTGVIQDVIPMDGLDATRADAMTALTGVGMAATGRVGPGKDEQGDQVYSFNVVFAAASFEEDGVIRSIKVDQLEVVTPNLGGGSAFSGFPTDGEGEEAFLNEVAAWTTKGAQGDQYKLTSGSWREQMDAYEQMMVGMTVDEVKEWYAGRDDAKNTAAQSETAVTDAADGGTAQVANDMANVPVAGTAAARTDAASSATMSLQGEYGDILLAIERAWEDAKRSRQVTNDSDNTLVDTNTVNDTMNGESNVG